MIPKIYNMLGLQVFMECWLLSFWILFTLELSFDKKFGQIVLPHLTELLFTRIVYCELLIIPLEMVNA